MKKLWKIVMVLFGGIVGVCGLFIWWIYERMAVPENELRDQLRQIINTHDKSVIQRLAVDDATEQFLLKASSDESIRTSDFQGGGSPRPGIVIGYFPAMIGTQDLHCYMVLDTHSFSLIPHWKLVKISLKPVGIDPTWAG
jgi:hypothetical protein